MLFDPLALLTLPQQESAPFPIVAGSSLEFLQAIDSDPCQPMPRRMRAAIAALPFEHPKLAVVATIDGGEAFAERLEAAIARSGKMIEGQRAVGAGGEETAGRTR